MRRDPAARVGHAVKAILGQSRRILLLSPSEETMIFGGSGKLSLMSLRNAVATSAFSVIREMNIKFSMIKVLRAKFVPESRERQSPRLRGGIEVRFWPSPSHFTARG